LSRNLSTNGLNLIKSFEGCKLTAYKCLPTEKYYTIGYGHYGSDVTAGMKITKEQAEELLLQDCKKAIKNVNSFMSKYNFNQNQFDALVSFAFNVGSINQLTASGTRTLEQISSKITAYNKSGGRVIAGLVKRRAKEKELFDTPTSTTVKKSNEEIAKEVVAGKWGNGNARKTALTKAGYDYKTIQSLVNKLLKG
jgi:GH24 family phage-related lysozyme (muramidase)